VAAVIERFIDLDENFRAVLAQYLIGSFEDGNFVTFHIDFHEVNIVDHVGRAESVEGGGWNAANLIVAFNGLLLKA
jgi:hypothetical protein